ncbi:MAG: hypothetical protein H3C34_17980, partial [Caldilineaceae bacterium]|nr:hypothetical protein [Caldilineaceae bacterium]
TYAQGRWPRRADIYVYQYTDDTLIHTVFNLDANRIESMESARGVQPALTAVEVQRATAILFVDAAVRSQIEREFEQITGQPLVSPGQLTVKAFVFHPDALPGHNLGSAAALCGVQRCAQLLITAAENVALQSVPVINLSAGVVAYLSRLDGGAQ